MQRHLRLREIRGLGETSVNMGTTFSIPRLARTVAMKRSCVALPFVKPYRKGSRCLVSLILAYVSPRRWQRRRRPRESTSPPATAEM